MYDVNQHIKFVQFITRSNSLKRGDEKNVAVEIFDFFAPRTPTVEKSLYFAFRLIVRTTHEQIYYELSFLKH